MRMVLANCVRRLGAIDSVPMPFAVHFASPVPYCMQFHDRGPDDARHDHWRTLNAILSLQRQCVCR